jgi:pilus assembly protein FimV
MKRVALGLLMTTTLAASVAAQATQPPAPAPAAPQTQPAAPASAAGDITITGCLQKGADGMFTLNNVQQDARATGTSGTTPAAPGAASTPGATSAPGAGASAAAAALSTWALKGGADLANHVGHRVSVTGKRPMASAAGAAPTSGAAGAPAGNPAGTSGTSPSVSAARTLEVASVKMISTTCQ